MDFGVSLSVQMPKTKENEKFFLWVYRIMPPNSYYPDFYDSVWLESIPADNFYEAMEYVENKKELIRRAIYANIERIMMFDECLGAIKKFIEKQKGNNNDND